MAFDEYLSLFAEAGLINDFFPERDAIVTYAQSMMTQLDEIDSDRHMKMQLVEFLEAVARAADLISAAPVDAIVWRGDIITGIDRGMAITTETGPAVG